FSQCKLLTYHFSHQLGKTRARLPSKLFPYLCGIAEQRINFGRPKVSRIDGNDSFARFHIESFLVASRSRPAYLHSQFHGGRVDKISYRMLLACGNDEVVWMCLLQHQPDCLHVVSSMSPVALGVQIAQIQAVLQSQMNPGESANDLARNKSLSTEG